MDERRAMAGIDRWLLIVIAVLAALDAYYTRKWLNKAEHELDEIRRESARALGIRDDDV